MLLQPCPIDFNAKDNTLVFLVAFPDRFFFFSSLLKFNYIRSSKMTSLKKSVGEVGSRGVLE